MRVEHGALVQSMPGFEGGGGVQSDKSGLGGGFKRVRLKQEKTLAHLVRQWYFGDSVSATSLEETLRVQDRFGQFHADAKARRVHQDDGGLCSCAGQDCGCLGPPGACAGPRLQAVH